jgi:hypothetical protein
MWLYPVFRWFQANPWAKWVAGIAAAFVAFRVWLWRKIKSERKDAKDDARDERIAGAKFTSVHALYPTPPSGVREGMRLAAEICANDESGRDSGGYFADVILAEAEKLPQSHVMVPVKVNDAMRQAVKKWLLACPNIYVQELWNELLRAAQEERK